MNFKSGKNRTENRNAENQPLTKKGNNEIGGGFNDDPLWLILGTVAYIKETGDSSILNRFYFVGHKDTNDVPGEEIKMEMDEKGNFSNSPYEMNHVRRHMYTLLKMEREYFGEIK